jgi:hypothetical protein
LSQKYRISLPDIAVSLLSDKIGRERERERGGGEGERERERED